MSIEADKIRAGTHTARVEPKKPNGEAPEPLVVAPCPLIDWTRLTGPAPPRIWWIPDWFTPKPTLCAGTGGAGKTTLWRAVGTALATGKRYMEDPVPPLKILMWLCEDDADEVHRQQAVVNAYFGIDMLDLKDKLYVLAREGHDNTLLDMLYGKPSFTPLLNELREQVNDLKIDVLVLDNLRQVFGGQENDGHQATYFVNGIAGLVRGRPFSPVFLGHVARSQGSEFSGNAAWENACRMRWFLGATLPDTKPEEGETLDPDVVYLARRKANYNSKDWRRLRFKNGLFVPEEPEGRRFDQGYRDRAAEQAVLDALPRLSATGVQPTDSKNSGDYLPTQIIAKRYHHDHTKKELTDAMHRLMGAGRLRRDIIGKYSNRTPKYGLVIP